MNKIKYIFCFVTLLGLASCSQEAPFGEESKSGSGRMLSSAINVELKVNENASVRSESNQATGDYSTRALPSVKDFTIDFIEVDSSKQIIEDQSPLTYTYGDMPDIVTLPVGSYVVKAHYGKNEEAAFNSPYYAGTSEVFEIEEGRVTSDINPIVCTLSNVRIGIIFDSSLINVMSEDSKVVVKVGTDSQKTLTYTKSTSEEGYFKYAEGSNTLIATFDGTIDGEKVSEIKTYDKVQPGLYYKITFKYRSIETVDPSDPGNDKPNSPVEGVIDPDRGSTETDNLGFRINASMEIEDTTDSNIDFDEIDDMDEYLEDDRPGPKPGDDNNPGGETPENPNTPDDPGSDQPGGDDPNDPGEDQPGIDDPVVKGPEITASEGINLNGVNDVKKLNQCVLYIHCDAGIKEFVADIDAPELTNDLQDMTGWESDASHLDLINPGEKKEFLDNLLQIETGEALIGQKDAKFDISEFLALLDSFKGIHKFNVKVTDLNNNSKTVTLQLEIK